MTFDDSIEVLEKVCDLQSSPRERSMQNLIYDLHSRVKNLRSKNKFLNTKLEDGCCKKAIPEHRTGMYWE